MAHFLNPLGQGGDHEEEGDGADGGQNQHRGRGLVEGDASCAKGVDAHHGEPASRHAGGDELRGAAGAILQRLENLADRAAVVIGWPGRRRDRGRIEVDPAARKVRADVSGQGALRKVLGIINFWQTQRVNPSLFGLTPQVLGGQVQGFLDCGHGCVCAVQLRVGGDHRVYARAQCADAIFDLSRLGFLRWLLLCRHVKPPHVNKRIRRQSGRLQLIVGVAVRQSAF